MNKSNELLADLKARTMEVIVRVEALQGLGAKELNYKASSDSWSILECIEHLNRYGDFYLPELGRCIRDSKKGAEEFKSGWLGNYFAVSMLPKEKLNKMKTFKVMNPAGSKLDQSVIERFLRQQDQMLELLNAAAKVSLTKNKTAISISKLIKLRLGDTLRVVIYHNQRHVVQAEKVLKLLSNASLVII